MHATRRRFLGLLAASAAAAPAAAAGTLAATPRQTAGPFYPQTLPLDADNDLVRVAGREQPAGGRTANVYGTVMDGEGRGIAGARVEIWQCDANGRYHHPDDTNPATPDENFQGYGTTVTDAEGRYRFRTIRPVSYPGRTPHIHYRVTTPSDDQLTTQLYVRGDPGNASDGIFRRVGDRQDLVLADFVPSADDSAELMARFDLVFG
jgi:protocatechuate 3,4-dioxygenase beta subunit